MSSSAELRRVAVLRGPGAPAVRPARLTAELATSPYAARPVPDARLVDPVLEQVVAEAAAAAAEQARRDGYADGYRAGTQAAEREARAAAEELARRETEEAAARQARLDRALAALHDAATQLERRQAPGAHELEERALRLAVQLAEELVGRELAATGSPALDAVRRALALAPEGAELLLRLHPDDVTVVADAAAALTHRPVRTVPDPAVEPGGCLLDAGACHVDARLSTALARVREVLA